MHFKSHILPIALVALLGGDTAAWPTEPCPKEDGSLPVYRADSEDCMIYYECSNGESVVNSCAEELRWDSSANECTLPELAVCGTED